MAEPLSTIAAAAQFTDFICRSIAGCYRFIQNLRDAPKDLVLVIEDLNRSLEVFQELHVAIETKDPRIQRLVGGQIHRMTGILRLAYKACIDLDKLLESCRPLLSDSRMARARGSLVSVSRGKDILKKLKRVQSLKNELYQDLQYSGFVILSSISQSIAVMESRINNMSNDIHDIQVNQAMTNLALGDAGQGVNLDSSCLPAPEFITLENTKTLEIQHLPPLPPSNLAASTLNNTTTCLRKQTQASGGNARPFGMPTDVGKLYPLGEKLCGGEEPYPQYDKSLVIQNPADTSLVQLLLRIKSTTGNSGLGRTFFPLGSVEQIITPHIVTEEITKGRDLLAKPLTDEHIHDYAQRVCFKGEQSLCRIFAILAMLQRPWEVVNFIDERISDIDLPLKTVTPSTNYMVRLQNPRTHGTLCSLGAFSHEQFQHLQWTMVPASFPKDTPHLRFDRRQAMPWSEEWYFNERYKSYAYLSRVRIHDAHHFFEHPYLLDGIFALKTFTSYHGSSSSSAIEELEAKADEVHSPSSLQTRQHFDRELKWLQGVAKFNHPHLRPFFAAYEHGDQSCLLFPWADAHLKLLWNNTTAGPPLERPSLMWLVKQFRGLADALQIFYTSVRNLDSHDRLPEIQGGISAYHILGYRDPNRADCATNATAYTLVLSGFDNSMPSETYQPPERNTQGNKASASDDVWSLGCIMLETIAWFVGGGEYVGKLLHCRKKPDVLNGGVLSAKFYSYVREPEARGDGPIFARVDVGVHDFVRSLRGEPGCSDTIHRILDLVMTNMLVVESAGLLQRASSAQVFSELDSIYQELQNPLFKIINTHQQGARTFPEAVEIQPNEVSRQILKQKFDQLEPHRGKFQRLGSTITSKRLEAGGESRAVTISATIQETAPTTSVQQRGIPIQTTGKTALSSVRSTGKPKSAAARKRRPSRPDRKEAFNRVPPSSSFSRQEADTTLINWALVTQILPHLVYLVIILSLLRPPSFSANHQGSQCTCELRNAFNYAQK